MQTTHELTGKVALVTGGGRGIGRAAALALAEGGADVAINYRANEAEAEKTRADVERLGRRGITVRADVSAAADVARMVKTLEEKLGPISILVNNAGIAKVQRLDEISEADWDKIIDVNLKSVFLVTRAVLPAMRAAKWGRIINMSSVAAQIGGVVGPHYAASKAGMLGITRSYASNLVKEGITANAIAPALIETDMVRASPHLKPDRIPVGRFGTIEECGDVVLMLARNGYITGQTINVNGGMYLS